MAGLAAFSHLVVVFQFHLVDPADVETGARRPRGNPEWPEVGMFAQRAKMRPNRLGVSTCRLRTAEGLDVKPFMREFEPPAAEVLQPAWSTELMQGYY